MDGKSREGSSALYHRSRYFTAGDIAASVALLVCFAVVVMPSLFTIAPNLGLARPAHQMAPRKRRYRRLLKCPS